MTLKTNRYFVKDIRRLTNTMYGNPRFKLIVADSQGSTMTMHTKPNANFSYTVSPTWKDRMIEAKTHKTKRITMVDDAKVSEVF